MSRDTERVIATQTPKGAGDVRAGRARKEPAGEGTRERGAGMEKRVRWTKYASEGGRTRKMYTSSSSRDKS